MFDRASLHFAIQKINETQDLSINFQVLYTYLVMPGIPVMNMESGEYEERSEDDGYNLSKTSKEDPERQQKTRSV